MSEFEDQLYKEDQKHQPAYFIRTGTDSKEVAEQMFNLEIDYQPIPYHFNT